MADRFFPNDIPDYIDEAAASSPAAELSSSSLHTLLSLQYPALADRFLHVALDLKQKATDYIAPLPRLRTSNFVRSSARAVIILVSSAVLGCARDVGEAAAAFDGGLHAIHGALGTALLLFRAFLITGDRADLATCTEIVSACDAASAGEEEVCGRVFSTASSVVL